MTDFDQVDLGYRFELALQILKAKPNFKMQIKRVLADGDFVVLHVHMVHDAGERGQAVVEIFRLENSKIVEHWDVIQPIPEKTANSNTMF